MLSGLLAASSLNADTLTWNAGAGTWSTSAANWTSASGSTAWVQGSDAVFTGFSAATAISVAPGIVLNSLTLTGATSGSSNATITFNGSSPTLDVTTITTGSVTGTSSTSIDMFAVLTGDHGLTLSTTAAGSSSAGRLNLKTRATYTGATVLNSNSYLLLDGGYTDLLPTGTLVTVNSGAVMRMGRGADTSNQIAGLNGSGTVSSQAGSAYQHTLKIATSSANGTQSFSGTLSNTTSILNLAITGDGTQAITGAAKTYSGTTTVSGGTLLLGSSLSNTSAVTVGGGSLRTSVASVTLGGNVSLSSGSINPNGIGSIGTLVLAANKNFTATGGTINFDIDSTSNLDKITGSGSGVLSLDNVTLALNLLTWSAADYNNSYTLFSGFSSGSAANLSFTGYDTANYTASLSNAGVLSFTAVPEPSTIALGALGIALVAFRLRRRAAQGIGE